MTATNTGTFNGDILEDGFFVRRRRLEFDLFGIGIFVEGAPVFLNGRQHLSAEVGRFDGSIGRSRTRTRTS